MHYLTDCFSARLRKKSRRSFERPARDPITSSFIEPPAHGFKIGAQMVDLNEMSMVIS